ncbi:hypothetical protein BDQ17DRAFT_1323639 [Cyathus striatus]|nr:hypothetical protein BDQ17DRAFT_1323639 [Cyathus striatus]
MNCGVQHICQSCIVLLLNRSVRTLYEYIWKYQILACKVNKVRVRKMKSQKKKRARSARVAEAEQENIETMHRPKPMQTVKFPCGQGRRAMGNLHGPQTQLLEGACAIKLYQGPTYSTLTLLTYWLTTVPITQTLKLAAIMPLTVPLEVADPILDEVSLFSEGSTLALKSCALACKDFLVPSQCRIFHTVILIYCEGDHISEFI